MELQKLLFPKPEICMAETLYYHRNHRCELDVPNSILNFRKDGIARFDTYFNGFSIGKWKKYTILGTLELEIELKGRFIVTLLNNEMINGAVVTRVIQEETITSENRKNWRFSFAGFNQKGIHSFILLAIEDGSQFFGGRYFTDDVSPEELPDVKLALNMCTFRKEKYIYRNVEQIRRDLIDNEQSPLYRNLYIYITDNAMTLDESKLVSPTVHVTKQNAFGSVGGFTRGLINILDDSERLGLTHTIMLDDDIVLDPAVLCRTYVLFRMMKEEYRDAWVGGGMLGLDSPTQQIESGGVIEGGEYHSLKAFLMVEDISQLLFNEIEEGAKINAWWYCGMPLMSISEDALPYPVYFHCDDMEYACRKCEKLILVNGIGVWHEEFIYKPENYYYDKRNREILFSLHFPELATKRNAKMRLIKNVGKTLLWYRYNDAHEIMDGVTDYLKGPDWLVSFDDRSKFESLRKSRVPDVPVWDLPFTFDYNKYLASFVYPPEKKVHRLWRRLTLNGWLLPAKVNAIIPSGLPITYHLYRAKRVLNYTVKTNSGYISEKSYRKAFYVLTHLSKTLWMIDRHYNAARAAYVKSIPRLTSSDFWRTRYSEEGNK